MLSLIHISEPTRPLYIFFTKKKKPNGNSKDFPDMKTFKMLNCSQRSQYE